MTAHKQLLLTIKALSGQSNNLIIPRLFIDIVDGDINIALLLNQLLYWCDKGGRKDGWFYKSYKDWYEEIGLTQFQVKRCVDILVKMNLLQVKLKPANGAPTLHYLLNQEKLVSLINYEINKRECSKSIINNLDNPLSRDSTMDYQETSQSLTDITTDITTDTNKTNKDEKMWTREKSNEATKKSLENFYLRNSGDYSQYPEDVRPVIERMENNWHLRAPTSKKKKGGQYALWIESCREVIDSCGEFGMSVLDELYKDWSNYQQSHGGLAPFNIYSPKSLINAVAGKAALMRNGNKPMTWGFERTPERKSVLDV